MQTPQAQLVKLLTKMIEVPGFSPKQAENALLKHGKNLINTQNLKVSGNLVRLRDVLVNNPSGVAKVLTELSPVELGKLSEAIAEARKLTGFKDSETGAESQALSSSWLIFGVYTPINEGAGTITITTIDGHDYFFPQPLKIGTWERMKAAQGRNGSGAGQIFWDEYWFKIKGKPKVGKSAVFERAARKKAAMHVLRNTQKEWRRKGI